MWHKFSKEQIQEKWHSICLNNKYLRQKCFCSVLLSKGMESDTGRWLPVRGGQEGGDHRGTCACSRSPGWPFLGGGCWGTTACCYHTLSLTYTLWIFVHSTVWTNLLQQIKTIKNLFWFPDNGIKVGWQKLRHVQQGDIPVKTEKQKKSELPHVKKLSQWLAAAGWNVKE